MSSKDGKIEYFKKLQMAEKFCNGNTEKAKKLINGEFDDILIIKGRFSDEDEEIFGLFLLFISRVYYRVVINFFLFTNYTVALQNKPINDWKTFHSRIEKEMRNPEFDMRINDSINNKLKEALSIKEILPVLEWLDNNDINPISKKFVQLLEQVLEKEKVEVDLDFEKTTSFVLYDIWKIKPPEPDNK